MVRGKQAFECWLACRDRYAFHSYSPIDSNEQRALCEWLEPKSGDSAAHSGVKSGKNSIAIHLDTTVAIRLYNHSPRVAARSRCFSRILPRQISHILSLK